jgi:hypothetical protein
VDFLIYILFFMLSVEISTPDQFIRFVERLPEIERVVRKDIQRQLVNSGDGQRSSLKRIEVPRDIALKSLNAETKITIGGTNVEVTKGDELILPKTDFKQLRESNVPLEDAITKGGLVVDMQAIMESLAKLVTGYSSFLDFAYPTKYQVNEFGSAGGIILPNNFGSYRYKGHDLGSIRGKEITKIISEITGKSSSTLNDTLMGLLPDYAVLGINGTGKNTGYRKGEFLYNPETGNFSSVHMPNIPGLQGQEQPLQALIAGGNPVIKSPKDYWGIPGVHNVLEPDNLVQNSTEVFERARGGDLLSIAILKNSAWWYEMLVNGIYSYIEVEKTSENLGEIGSTLQALRKDGYVKI